MFQKMGKKITKPCVLLLASFCLAFTFAPSIFGDEWIYLGELTCNPIVTVDPPIPPNAGGMGWDPNSGSFKGGGYGTGTYSWGSNPGYKIVWRARCVGPANSVFKLDSKELPVTSTGWSTECTTYGRTLSWYTNGYGYGEIDYIKLYSLVPTPTPTPSLTPTPTATATATPTATPSPGPDTPYYEPDFWNDGAMIQYMNNCYNYGCNKVTNTYAQPGRKSGYEPYPYDITYEHVRNAALSDGLEIGSAGGALPAGKSRAALAINPGIDYHWYRQDRDGKWSHKPGGGQATNLDNSGQIIINPQTANRGPYTVFAGYFFVDSDAVQGNGHEDIE
ncbi:MAG: hypothetical protein ACM3WV_00915 [Bacillota bacterium]